MPLFKAQLPTERKNIMNNGGGKKTEVFIISIYYLCQGGEVDRQTAFICLSIYLSVCLLVSKTAQNVINRF